MYEQVNLNAYKLGWFNLPPIGVIIIWSIYKEQNIFSSDALF